MGDMPREESWDVCFSIGRFEGNVERGTWDFINHARARVGGPTCKECKRSVLVGSCVMICGESWWKRGIVDDSFNRLSPFLLKLQRAQAIVN